MQNQPKILIVDDESRFSDSLKRLLAPAGYEIRIAHDARSALECLAASNFDIVLLDIILPDLSGYHLMDWPVWPEPAPLFIIMTGDASLDTAVEAVRKGAVDYLRKPFEPEDLFSAIEKALHRRQDTLKHDQSQTRPKSPHAKLQSEVKDRIIELVKTVWHLSAEFEECRTEQTALKSSKHRYIDMLRYHPDFIYFLNREGNFRLVGGAVRKLLGFRPEELMGQHFSAILPPADIQQVHWHFQERRTGSRSTRGHEISLVAKNRVEELRPVFQLYSFGLYRNILLRNPESYIGTFGLARDISAEKLLNQRLAASQRLAWAGELALSIAHEISSPIQGLLSLLSAIDRSKEPAIDLLDQIELLKDGLKQISQTTQGLLDLNRPRNDIRRALDVHQLIQQMAALVRSYLKERKIILEMDLDPALPYVLASRQQIGQVLMNLIKNAAEAISGYGTDGSLQGGPQSPGGRILVRTQNQKSQALIQIIDSGPGIPGNEFDQIFNPFYTGKQKKGMGLGLAICRQIIEDHGGRIWAENASAGGAVFMIQLPPMAP
jgi:PAS domain S-box-containing protein